MRRSRGRLRPKGRCRHDDAPEHPEHQHAAECDEREADLGLPYVPEPPDGANIEEPGGSDDDDHSERGLRQRLDQRHREEEKEPDDRGGDDNRALRLSATRVVDGRARVRG